MDSVIQILRRRGLLEAVTNPALEEISAQRQLTVYAGFDPSSDSLQAGNYVTIMALRHFQRCGHRVIALVGGATGLIGDPSGKTSERKFLTEEEVAANAEGIRENLSRFLDFNHPTAPARLVDNSSWMKDYPLIAFLRDVGKHFRMGSLLSKESVKLRLESEAGMSFAEFTYPLLQAYDFLRLYDEAGCVLQIGGSDQWGNITAGIDLIRRLRNVEVYGLTIPLVCDSSGRKFGKSEGNAVYLDQNKTSCYEFYQFFYRTADADVGRYLRIFTMLPEEEIAALETALKERPESREAARRLAEETTRDVHGEEGLRAAVRTSAALFGETMAGLKAGDLLKVFADAPSAELPLSEVVGRTVVDVAAGAGLCASRSEARRLAQAGGLYLNNRKVESIETVIAGSDLIDGRLLVLRSGRKNHRLIKVR